MNAILFRMPALDGPTLAVTAGLLGAVSLIACLLPSHRAARISPTAAMIEE